MAEHQGPEGGSLPSTSTITVTADDLIRSFPLPTLLITRPPNVDAMEIHTSVRTLHEALVTVTSNLGNNWSAMFKEEDEKTTHQQQDTESPGDDDEVQQKNPKNKTILTSLINLIPRMGKKQSNTNPEKTQNNTEKIKLMLDNMRDEIHSVLDTNVHRSLENFDSLSTEAQVALVEFWKEMRQFISVFTEWIEGLISSIIDRLLAGQRLDTQAFAKALQGGLDAVFKKLGDNVRMTVQPPAEPVFADQPEQALKDCGEEKSVDREMAGGVTEQSNGDEDDVMTDSVGPDHGSIGQANNVNENPSASLPAADPESSMG